MGTKHRNQPCKKEDHKGSLTSYKLFNIMIIKEITNKTIVFHFLPVEIYNL